MIKVNHRKTALRSVCQPNFRGGFKYPVLRKKIFTIVLILVACIFGLYLIKAIIIKIEFSKIMSTVDEQIPSLMQAQLIDSNMIQDVHITIDSSVLPEDEWYLWLEDCKVIFDLSDEFDDLDISSQYDFIKFHGDLVRKIKKNITDNILPTHQLYSTFLSKENQNLQFIYNKSVFSDQKFDIIFTTSNNTYKYSIYMDGWFVKNQKEIWLPTDSQEDDSDFKILCPYRLAIGANGRYTYYCREICSDKCNRACKSCIRNAKSFHHDPICNFSYSASEAIGWSGCPDCGDIAYEEWFKWYKNALTYSLRQ